MVVPGKKLGGNTGCRDVHHHQQEASYKSGKTKKRQTYLLLSFFVNNIWPTFSTFCINSIISDICFCIKDNAHNLNVRTPSLGGGEPQWPFGVFPKIHQNFRIRSSPSDKSHLHFSSSLNIVFSPGKVWAYYEICIAQVKAREGNAVKVHWC